jgi:hypothetical protein
LDHPAGPYQIGSTTEGYFSFRAKAVERGRSISKPAIHRAFRGSGRMAAKRSEGKIRCGPRQSAIAPGFEKDS